MRMLALVRRIEARFDHIEDEGLTAFLAVLTVLSFCLLPLVALDGASGALVTVAFSTLFVIGAFLGELSVRWRAFAIGLGFVSALAAWAGRLHPTTLLHVVNAGLSIVFMVLICVAILRQIFRPGEINGHRIRGAVAVYLLIGFVFALGFVIVEDLAPGSFHGMTLDTQDLQVRDSFYLSFVTLTTLGYGDITPASEIARSLAIVEAILGQLFLAVLIGRLISLSVANARRAD